MSRLVKVTKVDLETDEKEILFDRESKKGQRFLKPFPYKNYIIHLRLDYSDIKNGNPVLDADMRDNRTGKCIKKEKWHHTKCETQAGKRTYTFVFEELVLRMYIIETFEIAVSFNAHLVKK